jgi:K+ potassium transporter
VHDVLGSGGLQLHIVERLISAEDLDGRIPHGTRSVSVFLVNHRTPNEEHPQTLCPEPLLIPFIVLGTLATIIASQPIITGAFSMTRQAIQLGWLPRLQITQTMPESSRAEARLRFLCAIKR